jgi:SAM-dependent methyltransferase
MLEQWWDRYVIAGRTAPRPQLLDLGCGTGLWLDRRRADAQALGADFSLEALRFCRERKIEGVVQADATALPFPDSSFDAVTAFDLIEHVDRDDALVAEVHRVLRPGGILLASVPAYPALWSGHDISLHHFRRYTPLGFEALFDAGQWQSVRMSHGFCLLFPIAASVKIGRRMLRAAEASDTRPTTGWLNRIMIEINRVEAAMLRHVNLPWGTSLMTIRRKL